jgi:biopolymer transport protein ExbB/TolQ
MIVEKLLKIALLGSAWVLWLLLALSVLSVGQIIERWSYFRRRRDDAERLRRGLEEALLADDLERAKAVLAASPAVEAGVVHRALRWKTGGPRAFSDAVESELSAARADLERGMNLLGTLGSNAPFIGLFGTVIGVIEAFNHLGSSAARAGSMGNVMAGIAEALVATAVGIFVAVPAVVAYNVAQKRIGEVEASASALARLVTAWLETSDRRAAAAGGK